MQISNTLIELTLDKLPNKTVTSIAWIKLMVGQWKDLHITSFNVLLELLEVARVNMISARPTQLGRHTYRWVFVARLAEGAKIVVTLRNYALFVSNAIQQ